jgi:hypothetical protein
LAPPTRRRCRGRTVVLVNNMRTWAAPRSRDGRADEVLAECCRTTCNNCA